ncbi:hypothetical protein AVEN_156534-1 [Araneus ventricosus]|uniref:Uncharacterized protein n=1 Tax=Araneus ventricosus TaxID=182803 RepID=A0A4Y2TF22_ARAVE|nr:hypothetical protein AVEN_156534-1 [Araneus ventricosus]
MRLLELCRGHLDTSAQYRLRITPVGNGMINLNLCITGWKNYLTVVLLGRGTLLDERYLLEVQQKGARTERVPDDYFQPGKLTYGRLAGRRLPFLNKAPEKGRKVSTLCGKKNGLYLEGSIYGIPCSMLVDTGANVTLLEQTWPRN